MAEPQLSVRSAKARELAHRLARYERRSVAEAIERALEMYQARQLGNEPAGVFNERPARDCATDVDLDALIREERRPKRVSEWTGAPLTLGLLQTRKLSQGYYPNSLCCRQKYALMAESEYRNRGTPQVRRRGLLLVRLAMPNRS
jgi:hypothetical protein